MRTCIACGVSIDGSRADARTCSAACRRAVSRSAADTLGARDAAAAALLLREREALEARRGATTLEQLLAADTELDRIGEHVDRLFGVHA